MVEGLRRAGLSDGVTVLEDSEQALSFLTGEKSQRPVDVVFLDLNLTPMSGLDLLDHIRSNPRLESIPVIIMSGSQNADDVRKAYKSGANCYILKPSDLDRFLSFMKVCYEFWGSVVTLPPRSAD
jgi:two-component system, chemotaxis family, response regulator Rcp1